MDLSGTDLRDNRDDPPVFPRWMKVASGLALALSAIGLVVTVAARDWRGTVTYLAIGLGTINLCWARRRRLEHQRSVHRGGA